MSKIDSYSSAIKEWPLMFSDTKKTAILLSEGKTKEEIILLSKTENIYQLTKEKRRIALPQKILVRLGSLNREQIDYIANGSDSIAKILIFIAILKTDKLLYEFMKEIYSENSNSGINEILDSDFVVFFERKANESKTVADWKNDNLEKIKNAYKRILIDTELVKKNNNALIITKAIFKEEDVAIIKKDNEIYTDTFLFNR